MRLSLGLLLVVVSGLVAGCDSRPPAVKAQERLIELRFEQTKLLDELYASYGTGELATAVKNEAEHKHQELEEAEPQGDGKPAQKEGPQFGRELLKAVGNAAIEVDRAAFDSHCTVAGSGERPSILSEKGRAFFSKQEVLETCKKVAKLEIELDAQEAELARLRAQATSEN